MNEESLQLLNLSPIPELSEVELSLMLDQLSGFQDQTSDATDCNIEDILREAEELIDKSISCNVLNGHTTSPPKLQNEIYSNFNEFTSSELSSGKNVESCNPLDSNSNLSSGCCVVMQSSHQLLSPDSNANHIKSTIDALREMSNLMEKEIIGKGKINGLEHQTIDTLNINKKPSDYCFPVRSENHEKSQLATEDVHGSRPMQIEKSSKTLKNNRINKKESCFKGLYNDKETRFCDTIRGIKPERKALKSLNKSSLHKEEKAVAWGKNGKEKGGNIMSITDMKKYQNKQEGVHSVIDSENFAKAVDKNEITDGVLLGDESQRNISLQHLQADCHLGSNEGPIMLKLLQELKEIKDKIKGNGVPKWSPKEVSESNGTSDSDAITRLQKQFYLLKNKYDQQVERLELENEELREALNRDLKPFMIGIKNGRGLESQSGASKSLEAVLPTFLMSNKCSKVPRSLSLEDVWILENRPRCEADPVPGLVVTEACSQTESERRNVSVQCDEEKTTNVFGQQRTNDGAKVEDKENVWQKRKVAPFSDPSVPSKQKKGRSEHETQLLVTLRSVQAEAVAKDKENRKLKAEVDMLKAQARRLGQKKMEGIKKSHAGVQTVGLGPQGHRPYDPRLYEAETNSLEKENLELKARVKALEDGLEALKQKRINDLQSLHQVHEKEIGKLASKLESQSALAKYLHSLLLKR